MKSIPWLVVAVAIMGSILCFTVFWSQLPDEVASHFDPVGNADGWMSKPSFVAVALLTQVGTAAMMFGFCLLIRVLPTSLINIPNREYWLADERREQTLDESVSLMAWIAAGTTVFLMIMFCLTIGANIGQEKAINPWVTWVCVAAYLVWLAVFCIVRLKKYYRVPTQ